MKGVRAFASWSCPLKMEFSALFIKSAFWETRVSQISIAPSRPPVAKTFPSSGRYVTTLTDREWPLKVRIRVRSVGPTSQSRLWQSLEEEISFCCPGVQAISQIALSWHWWPTSVFRSVCLFLSVSRIATWKRGKVQNTFPPLLLSHSPSRPHRPGPGIDGNPVGCKTLPNKSEAVVRRDCGSEG